MTTNHTIQTDFALTEEVLVDLKTSFRGQLVLADHTHYNSVRSVWNGMIDKRPALIAQCAGVADCIGAVIFARQQNLIVAVRGGGHSFAGNAVCDNGLVIDLSLMRSIRVDVMRKTVRAEGGALLSDLDYETQVFGLAVPSGTVSHTGVAGLTLGGGQGWLMNKYGLTCDNLLAADIILADGRFLTVSNDQHPDLFWAIRGGGGNFGIVTSFEFQLHPVGPTILGGMVLYPITQAAEVLRFYRDFSMSAPDELGLIAGLLSLPDGTPAIAIVAGWCGSLEEGETVLAPLRAFGTPLADLIGPMAYGQLQKIFDAAVPHGLHRYTKMGYLPTIDDNLIERVVQNFALKPSAYSFILFNVMHGAVNRVAPEATAFPHRRPHWHFDVVAQWVTPDEAKKNLEWTQNFWQEVEPFTQGTGANFLDSDDGLSRVKAAYGTNYERLARLKNQYDPENFFRLNNNIVPANG
ncbi:FAD-binding oxidoreductase [Larkinella sp. GY13]|uniref:FAD-binding oxidoreductase n=1 Tax=Larkinella sp. GY13 TaxID=3453720 RepID=UPI003EE8730F